MFFTWADGAQIAPKLQFVTHKVCCKVRGTHGGAAQSCSGPAGALNWPWESHILLLNGLFLALDCIAWFACLRWLLHGKGFDRCNGYPDGRER